MDADRRPEAHASPIAVRNLAEDYFHSGLYCAEAVVTALAKAQGIDSGLVPKMATAFCSGMSRTCGTCGALTGAVMGLSLGLGRTSAGQPVSGAYRATEELVRTFEREFGARDCDQLLGCDIGTPEGRSLCERENRYARCERYTARAAEIAATLLARAGR